MRPAVLIHDRVFIDVQIGGWEPLFPLLVDPHARPGLVCTNGEDRGYEIFIPFEQKKPYRLAGGRRTHYKLSGKLSMVSYRAEESHTKPKNWKVITKQMGTAKKLFVEKFL
jgi:hypothetical protein